jgi:hypothetical protein
LGSPGLGVVSDGWSAPVDRAAELLTEANAASGLAAGLAATLDALRRQGRDNAQQLAELRLAVDSLRGEVPSDRQLLGDLGRAVVSLRAVVAKESTRTQQRLEGLQQSMDAGSQGGELKASIAALRSDLAGIGAHDRWRGDELQGAIDALRSGLAGFSTNNRHQMEALRATVADQAVLVEMEALRETVAEADQTVHKEIAALRATVADQSVLAEMQAVQAAVADAAAGQAALSAAVEKLVQALGPDGTTERLAELERLLNSGLPRFGREIQGGIQQVLLDVGRTFRLAEREHGNRMAELQRAFDASARRIEATLEEARRRDSNRRAPDQPPA